jgi:hypothetical protein
MITKALRIIISRLRKNSPLSIAAILLNAILAASAESHTPQFPEVNLIRNRTAAGHPYLNGGTSHAEQRVMERAADPYNLKLVFASRLGTPVTPAFVVIGANNGQHIEKVLLRAPWFYIQLPPGGYTILTRFKREVVLVRDVNITEQRVRKYFLRGN